MSWIINTGVSVAILVSTFVADQDALLDRTLIAIVLQIGLQHCLLIIPPANGNISYYMFVSSIDIRV